MRSATSYFNGTLYRKTLARFWPLWAGYGLVLLLFIPLNMLNLYFSRYMSTPPQDRLMNQAVSLIEFAVPGLYYAAFFAILCAMAVFGYLYNSRSVCWSHALPLRREALFTTQYLAGLSFLLLPQLVTAALTAMIEMAFLPVGNWSQALSVLLAWLAAQSGVCLFFFSFAAFCAMFTGHILALPAFYAILNALVFVVYFLVDSLIQSFIYGYAGSSSAQTVVEYLTPGVALRDAVAVFGSRAEGYSFNSPETIAAYAAAGLVLAAASLYVYCHRHAETAGDVVAIPLVRPLFKYGVSFCAGLCFGMFTTAFFNWYTTPPLILSILGWSVVGYFVAEMLLKKSFRVFRAWKGALIMPAVLLVLCLVCATDLFGVAHRVPGLDSVQSVEVRLSLGYPSDGGHWLRAELTDPAQIQYILDLHRAVADQGDEQNWNRVYDEESDFLSGLQLQYRLQNGKTLIRQYNSLYVTSSELEQEGTLTWAAQRILDNRDLVSAAYGIDQFPDGGRIIEAYLTGLTNPNGDNDYSNVYVDDYAQELWEAVRQDYDEGTIGVRYLFDYSQERMSNTYYADLNFTAVTEITDSDGMETYSSYRDFSITLTPQARHTLAVLDKTGIWEEGYSLKLRQSTSDLPDEYELFYPGANQFSIVY